MSGIAVALKHMLAAGMPHDAIVTAIAEMEASLAVDQVAERRRAYDRERKAKAKAERSGGIPVESAESAECADSPLSRPPNEINSNPPTHTPEKQTPRARGTTIPIDWTPKPFGVGTVARSIVDGWPPGVLEEQAEHFAAHHRAKGTVSKDWHDSWSTWVHNSKRFKGFGNGQSKQPNRGGSTRDAAQLALSRMGYG